MDNYLIKNAKIVNNGVIFHGFVLVREGVIKAVSEGYPCVDQDQVE